MNKHFLFVKEVVLIHHTFIRFFSYAKSQHLRNCQSDMLRWITEVTFSGGDGGLVGGNG